MQADQTPPLVPLPFATNGLRNDVPEESQIGVTPGAASFNDGFPPVTMQPKTQGGVPPDGRDFNGVLYALSQTVRWVQAGGRFVYRAPFATDPNVGGYPQGAVLLRADYGGFWFNEADNNTTNPDAADGSARNWVSLNADWNAASGPGQILHRPLLAAVATSGSYSDLTDTPAIPPVLGFTPVQQGGGVNQGNNKVYIGWRPAGNGLGVTVDQTDEGNVVFEAELQTNVASLQNNINNVSNAVAALEGQVGSAWTPGNLQSLNVNGIGYVTFIVKSGDSSQSAAEGTVMALPGRPGSWLSGGNAAAASDYWCVWTRIA